MQKQIGALLLVAGTSIGSGMIALPMVLAKLGIIPSVIIMLVVWATSYKSALVSVELNLQAKTGLSLGALGRRFSGTKAEAIGTASLKLLLYSLLAVYIYGMASMTQKLADTYWQTEVSSLSAATCVAIGTAALLLLPIKLIDYVNRIAFAGLLTVFLILLCSIVASVDTSRLPLATSLSLSDASSVLSVVFTSFGFHVIFHTLANYCGLDAKTLKRAFFYGSLIPAILYVAWTYGALSVLYGANEAFYAQMSAGQKDVGDLIKELSSISNLPNMQLLVWMLSLSAVFTSILGVGAALTGSIDYMLTDKITSKFVRKITCSAAAIVPAYVVATAIPNAFIKIFGFAGAILSIIAIFMPLYLLYKADIKRLYYSELSNKWLLALILIFGIVVAVSEILL
jgi:tyrosine-specific transport protein